jgi:hypothetical protein
MHTLIKVGNFFLINSFFSTFVRGLLLHLFGDFIYDFTHNPRFLNTLTVQILRNFVLVVYIIMAAWTSTAVSFAQDEDGSRLRAVVDRTMQGFKDYTSQYEDQCNLVEALGTAVHAPGNKNVIGILAQRKRRLNAALVKKTTAIVNLANFSVAETSALHVQATVTATASAIILPPAPATTTTAVPDNNIMKMKLPEPRDGWKYPPNIIWLFRNIVFISWALCPGCKP